MTPKSKILLHDLSASAAAWLLALFARFNFEAPPPDFLEANLTLLPLIVVIQAAASRFFNLYRGLWRFASLPDLWNIVRAAALGTMLIGTTLFLLTRLHSVPRSMLVLYPLLLIFFLGGPRLAYRMWKDHSLSLGQLGIGERVLILGAGNAGEAMVRDLLRAPGFLPVGLLDDNPALWKARIRGVPVLGGMEGLTRIVDKHAVELLVIAVPTASNAQMQRIVSLCEESGVPFRTLPRLHDIVSGKVTAQALREVSISDLLGREKVELDWPAIQGSLRGRCVLVTGGGGSIGSELCRQIAALAPAQLIVFDQSELNVYQIQRELHQRFPDLKLAARLGDVCDSAALERVFSQYHPQCVFHAAAYKHVPLLEGQVREAVRNNILGSANVIDAAERHRCESFVLISTDKAVQPGNVMGATKRFVELLCAHRNRSSETRFVAVRFGNVLDSAGSVVPLFREQVAAGGPVTVTHADATRYFMTITEASQLILAASTVGNGGDVFVLDMGEPVRIEFLAEQVIRLSGLEPGRDIEIRYTGLRPGEKMTEELFYPHEALAPTAHEKLLLAKPADIDGVLVEETLSAMREKAEEYAETELLELLKQVTLQGASDGSVTVNAANVIALKRNL